MRVVARIDAQGLYVEDVLLEDGQALPTGCIESRPPEGLHAPKWTGSTWTEGKPAAEILTARKASKRAEMEGAYTRECAADFSSPWAAVGVLAASPTDPRVGALKTRTGKLRDKLAAVEAATTAAEVEAISWT